MAKIEVWFPAGGALLVTYQYIGIFADCEDFARSLAAWRNGDRPLPDMPWITMEPFPDTLRALIAGLLDGCPPYGLIDYLLEHGPANLRAELEQRMASAAG